MANPRRSSYSSSSSASTNSLSSPENPLQFHNQNNNGGFSSHLSLLHFLKKPHAFPFLLSVFILLTWLFLRLQTSSSSSSSSSSSLQFSQPRFPHQSTHFDDSHANLKRFDSGFAKDKRGWLINPVSLALDSGLSGGAITCASVHVGEIRPGGIRGNHRHYTCNETFVIWGATTKFRVENNEAENGYAEVIIGEDEVAVAASPSGIAHALVNVDRTRTTFFLGCQDSIVDYNTSTTDFNVWKDL